MRGASFRHIIIFMTTRTAIPSASEERLWQQLLHRDASAPFVYAVCTTGVFCRPGCASRLPLRKNVRFFPDSAAASVAGFRPCQRCRPDEPVAPNLAEQVCRLLQQHLDSGASGSLPLARLAQLTGRSPFAIQRAFQSALGVSPAQYLARLRTERFASELSHPDQSITDAIHASGYSSSSRAYSCSPLGLTPSSLRKGAFGERIEYAIEPCNLRQDSVTDHALSARTARGLCWLAFGDSPQLLFDDLRARFHAATLLPSKALGKILRQIIANAQAGRPTPDLPLDLRGTAFQLRVWNALRQIPVGQTRSYSQLARELGQPSATRAVARACATNSVALAVPCHRVVASSGALSGYRWGIERKRALLEAEQAGKPHHAATENAVGKGCKTRT